jgi:MFS family permease
VRAPFGVDAIFSLIACVLLVRFVPTRAARPDEGHSWVQLRRLKVLFTNRRYYAFALFCGVNNVAFPVLSAFLPVKARSLGADPRQISLILALEAVCFSLACWLVGQASDRWGRRAFVIAAQPGVISSCVGLALAQSWPWLAVWYGLFGLAGGATFLLGLLMAADVTPRADAAGTLGAFDAAVDLLIFAAPAAALAVHRQLGRTDPLLLAAGLPALLALPVALMVSETKPHKRAIGL